MVSIQEWYDETGDIEKEIVYTVVINSSESSEKVAFGITQSFINACDRDEKNICKVIGSKVLDLINSLNKEVEE